MSANVQWQGREQMRRRIDAYGRKVKATVRRVADYWKAVFEDYAKENASWADRTGNARQTLHAFVEELAGDSVNLYLSHGVDYGVYLETKYAGRYAIIWPTIERHLPEIKKMLQEIFGT